MCPTCIICIICICTPLFLPLHLLLLQGVILIQLFEERDVVDRRRREFQWEVCKSLVDGIENEFGLEEEGLLLYCIPREGVQEGGTGVAVADFGHFHLGV